MSSVLASIVLNRRMGRKPGRLKIFTRNTANGSSCWGSFGAKECATAPPINYTYNMGSNIHSIFNIQCSVFPCNTLVISTMPMINVINKIPILIFI